MQSTFHGSATDEVLHLRATVPARTASRPGGAARRHCGTLGARSPADLRAVSAMGLLDWVRQQKPRMDGWPVADDSEIPPILIKLWKAAVLVLPATVTDS